MASPHTDGPSPPTSHQDTPDTPSSIAPPTTPISATAALSSGLAPDASKLPSRRGKITQIACVACRQRKSKCDGARPVCQSCRSRPNSKCVYDVTLDQRKPSSLRQRVGELEQEIGNFRDILPMLLNALPDRLKPQFQGFVQSVEEAGLSDQLLDDARGYLVSQHESEEPDQMEGLDQFHDNTDTKFTLNIASQATESTSEDPQNVPYFSDHSPDTSEQHSSATISGGLGGARLAIPMPVDNAGIGTSYWSLDGMDTPAWSTATGEQPDHGRAIVEPLRQRQPHAMPQAPRWHMSTGNAMRTLHLFGQVDSLHPSQGEPVDLNTHIPVYLVQPLTEDDRKPLSSMYSGVYAGYRDSKRQMIKNGANAANILGHAGLDFRSAFKPTTFHNDLPLPVWTAELFGAHRNLRPSDRVACAWMVTTLLRWQISPTREHYERVPPWLRPSPKQCFVPHAANIDYLPWPLVRDALIDVKADNVEVTVNSLSVNWPRADNEVLYLDQQSNRLVMTSAFQNHILSLDNWTLSASLLDVMPELQGLARLDSER